MASSAAPHVGSEFPLLSCFFEFWEEVENLRRQVQVPGGSEDVFLPAAAGGREHLAEALRLSPSRRRPSHSSSWTRRST
jgi:hypothetical protein